MPDLMVRAVLLVGLVGVAVAVGVIATRVRRVSQPQARVVGLGFDAAIIAFTSTDCSNCRKVMRRLSKLGVPVREVAYELEPQHFEEAGVEGVPLVVVTKRDGTRSAQFGGSVGKVRLRRALARAGW
jgi:hypothetical protein